MRVRAAFALLVSVLAVAAHARLSLHSAYSEFNKQEALRLVVSVKDGKAVSRHVPEDYVVGLNDAAWAKYTDANTTGYGWSLLEVHTVPGNAFTDAQRAYSAGYAEGQLVALPLWQLYNDANPSTSDPKVLDWIATNQEWMAAQIAANPTDPYWNQVSLALQQLKGLEDGYNSVCAAFDGCQLSTLDFLFISASDEVGDIQNAVGGKASNVLKDGKGHCSALIKLLPDNSELFTSQVTWSEFNGMVRTYKLYDFQFALDPTQPAGPSNTVPGAQMSFSSYPGCLFSGDDFYQMSPSSLVVLETTIGYNNMSLASYVVPQTVMEWIRNLVANRLATSAESWTQIFAENNSGTYCNQFMVVDYSLFVPGQPLADNTVWVLEQLPGPYVRSQDLSPIIASAGYWGSYNVIYNAELFNVSESYLDVEKWGSWFTWDMCPRAQIFRRDQDTVTDLASMQRIMRYNKFQTDPLSRCNCTPPYSAENAIASRSDLNSATGVYPFSALGRRAHGATDGKITSSELNALFAASVVYGPTHDDQPAFDWNTANFPDLMHVGMPDVFEFEWTTMTW